MICAFSIASRKLIALADSPGFGVSSNEGDMHLKGMPKLLRSFFRKGELDARIMRGSAIGMMLMDTL
tara:strand:+ start:349 stop:549 length:201 start_codon:yes stop_codon:yes gene_type:complete